MVNIKTEFPRGISDQAISRDASTEDNCVRPGPGLKRQASSFRTNLFKHQATSVKPQAASFKLQAAGRKLCYS